MKIFIDTNILISAVLFPNGKAALAYEKRVTENECFISEYVIKELAEVVKEKFPQNKKQFEAFILQTAMIVEIIKDNKKAYKLENTLRDKKDIPIYRSAKSNNCDAIFTGDKDFIDNKKLDIKIVSAEDILKGL